MRSLDPFELVLNDVYPEWCRSEGDGGFFSDLLGEIISPPEYLTPTIAAMLDTIYHGNRSGLKPLSTLLAAMYDRRRNRLTIADRQRIAGSVWIKYSAKWSRLWSVKVAEYNKLNNYDMTETTHGTETPDIHRTESEKNQKKSTTTTASSTNVNTYGFNSTVAVPLNTGGGNQTVTNNEPLADNKRELTSSETGTREHASTVTRSGNIGVMTSQSLLTEEIKLWQWQFYDDMMTDVDSVLTRPLYFGSEHAYQTIYGYAPEITTTSLPNGRIGVWYQAPVNATGSLPITWSVHGAFPPGLTLSDEPPVVPGTAPTITTATLPGGTVSQTYDQTLQATGDAPIAWSCSGALPAGLSFDAAAHRLHGTPTAVGSSTITITAENAYGSDSKTYTLAIADTPAGDAPRIDTASVPGGTVGAVYEVIFLASGTSPIAWSYSGTLPAGLTFDVTAHKLRGTPTAAGTSTFTVKAANAYGSDQKAYTVTIASEPVTEYTWGKYWVNTISQNTYSNDSGWGNADWYQDPIVEDAYRSSDVDFSVANGLQIHGGGEYATTSDGAGITCCKGDDVRVERYIPRGEQLGWDLTIRTCDKTSTPVYERGSYISDVTSADRHTYPDDGKQGDFWYVFIG